MNKSCSVLLVRLFVCLVGLPSSAGCDYLPALRGECKRNEMSG
jgi:hypothetical protein